MRAIVQLPISASVFFKQTRALLLVIKSFRPGLMAMLTTVPLLAFTLSATAVERQPNLTLKAKTSERTGVTDRDLDGVLDEKDNCPSIPNEPMTNGKQPLLCNGAYSEAIDRNVFLGSRTFRAPKGLDSKLKPTGKPTHVFLHIKRDADAAVLLKQQRRELIENGVKLWQYVPHYTYYATVPGTRAELAKILALPFVQGISAIEPRDRMARGVRSGQGGLAEKQPDGTLQYAVEFFSDVPKADIAELLKRLKLSLIREEEDEHIVKVQQFDELLALAKSDLVYWIDHAAEGLQKRDEPALIATSADLVEKVQGFNGSGLKVAMVEADLLPLPPGQHPDMTKRVIADSDGQFIANGHNLEVAGIMIGDGTLDTTKRGFLPEAILIDFAAEHQILGSSTRKTARKIAYKFPKEAREHHGAVVINYSNGPPLNCSKVGEYTKWGKHLDKAVYEVGISVVRAAGNSRGPNGDLADDPKQGGPTHGPCEADLESLPHQVAKNDIAVGNWGLMDDVNCGAANTLCNTSAAGPSADGRLKPDVVAPGQGVSTTTLGSEWSYAVFGGTSAAAPVTSGVIGQIYDAFRSATVARNVLDVPPSSAKAVLIHTARDVGPPGPDYFHGWGLINAASAVRVALHHDKYLHEATVTASSADVHHFDVTGNVYSFKVTLVWDDPPAGNSETPTLQNDLDLMVTDPSGGKTYFPFDTRLSSKNRLQEALQGAKLCASLLCRDRVNNVEQVLITDPTGAALPTGTWTATVSAHRLVEDEQRFSLVVTPTECPVHLYHTTPLAGPVTCAAQPLEPVAISIERDNVALNCNDQAIKGTGRRAADYLGRHTGIYTERSGVTISNCKVKKFDVGIGLTSGNNSVITGNTIEETNMGIQVDASREGGMTALSMTKNTILNVQPYGIQVKGQLLNSSISANIIDATTGQAGIKLYATPTQRPENNKISFNYVSGGPIGITLEGVEFLDSQNVPQVTRPLTNEIFGNLLGPEVAIGINDLFGQSNKIFANIVQSGSVGIQSNSSLGEPVFTHISLNNVTRADTGISISGPASGSITGNVIGDANKGVWVNLTQGETINVRYSNRIHVRSGGTGIQVDGATKVLLNGNDIWSDDLASGIGINVQSSNDVTVQDNTVHDLTNGIAVTSSTAVTLQGNTVADLDTGIAVSSTPSIEVSGNTVRNAKMVGLSLSGDAMQVVGNVFEYDPSVLPPPTAQSAIHYLGGRGSVISGNTMISFDPTEHGVLVGTLSALAKNQVHDLTIDSLVADGHTNGITIGKGVFSIHLDHNTVTASNTGLLGTAATDLRTIDVTCNSFTGGSKDAVFPRPVDTSFNVWSEVPAPVQVLDSNGDGYGDSGTGYPFCSSDYSGNRTCPAQPFASFKTSQISDDAPWLDTSTACPLTGAATGEPRKQKK
jgi:parallel beta-helix repeat protein